MPPPQLLVVFQRLTTDHAIPSAITTLKPIYIQLSQQRLIDMTRTYPHRYKQPVTPAAFLTLLKRVYIRKLVVSQL